NRRATRFLLGFVEVGEDLHRALVKSAPALGEAHPASRAVQQARLQMRFELGDVSGRRGRGQPELLRSAREAPTLNHLREHPERLKTVHGREITSIRGIIN